jgi:hypothetical protein
MMMSELLIIFYYGKINYIFSPEMEDYLNGPSSSSSADYCEYNRTVKNIPNENETKVKCGQIHVNVKIMKKSCLKKSDGLEMKKKIKFVAEIEENEGKSKVNRIKLF